MSPWHQHWAVDVSNIADDDSCSSISSGGSFFQLGSDRADDVNLGVADVSNDCSSVGFAGRIYLGRVLIGVNPFDIGFNLKPNFKPEPTSLFPSPDQDEGFEP